MKIIAGSGAKKLAREISEFTRADYVEASVSHFADGELKVQITASLQTQVAVIVQAISTPVNDRLMEFLLLVDAAKKMGSRRIIALVPYMGYSRQDRRTYEHGPISASLVARLFEAAGVDHVVTVDLHSKQIEGFFRKATVDNIGVLSAFADPLQELRNVVVVSPDTGGVARARTVSDFIGAELVVVDKIRDKNDNSITMSHIIGNVKGTDCIIIDDIVDSGGTLCRAAELLMEKGATRVSAYVTHSVLSGKAADLIQSSALQEIFVTDSIKHGQLPDKFKVVPIAKMLGERIKA